MYDHFTAPVPPDELSRLENLRSYEILDSGHEEAFDDIVMLASHICGVPISAISLVDHDRQWFKASVGLTVEETPRNISFCQHTILGQDVFVVPDALQDSRFKGSPLVTEGVGIRFYAGAPLLTGDGSSIGALCVKDTKPRQLTPEQADALSRLARQVVGQLELRKQNLSLYEKKIDLERKTEELNEAHRHSMHVQQNAQKMLHSLSESEERFRAFAENASDGFYMLDTRGRILYVNQAASKSLGYSEQHLLKKSISDIAPDIDGQVLSDLWSNLGNSSTSTFQGFFVKQSGDRMPVEIKFSKCDLRGSAWLFAIVSDQTEQVKALEELRKGEERFNLVCRATNDVVWDLDLVTGRTWVSPNYTIKYGPVANGVSPSFDEWLESIHPDDRHRVSKSFADILRNGESSWQCEYLHKLDDGSYAFVLDRAFVITDENGAPTRAIGAITDLTATKQAEQDRHEREHAERANHAKSQFLSRMSHELRTPLNSILGFAQLLEMYSPTDQQGECIQRILSGGKHLLGLINEVLDLSRIESGNMQFSLEPVHLASTAEEAISLALPLAKQTGISIVKSQSADASLFALADRQRLLQVLINLISNGIKYNHEGGTVEVGYGEKDGRVLLTIADTGKGIGKDLAHRVFMPFDRLGIEQKDQIEGTGLGLALSKSLAEAMGAELSFTSTVGVGTTFTVDLALTKELAADNCSLADEDIVMDTRARSTILYIEDNESNMALMRSVIASRPHWSFEVATNGKEGLERFTHIKPDLLLLDLDLPDISGYEILTRLRADQTYSQTPILIVSADATQDRIDRLISAGANGYITKPFDVRDLLRQMGDLLNKETQHAA